MAHVIQVHNNIQLLTAFAIMVTLDNIVIMSFVMSIRFVTTVAHACQVHHTPHADVHNITRELNVK